MGLLQRLSHDLRVGWVTLRHGTAKAATRALEEGELLRYRLELRKLDQQLDDLHGDIGERTIELHDRDETADRILSDADVTRMLQQVRTLQDERTKLLLEMNDITVEGE
ncbi:MAG: hypothetical protein OJF47_001548 [Nitrospira sp.]|jgi:hypothetical protein|nr:MAG: hypothetical protein OJF47_001548 [Nitrospira sp.]